MVFVRLLVHLQLAFQHLICGDSVSLSSVGIFEILSATIESVGCAKVSRLHIMINCLHIDHALLVQINIQAVQSCLCPLPGIWRKLCIAESLQAVGSCPLDLLREHRQIEFGRIESGKVAIPQPIYDFSNYFYEFRFVSDILVFDPVHFRCLRVDSLLLASHIVPRAHAPCFHLRAVIGENLHETKFNDRVIY